MVRRDLGGRLGDRGINDVKIPAKPPAYSGMMAPRIPG
jgi:hypothetical protein